MEFRLKNLMKVENPNYVFITINTNEINTPKFKIFLKMARKPSVHISMN